MFYFVFYVHGVHPVLPVLTHSFPSQRSSDLAPLDFDPCRQAWDQPSGKRVALDSDLHRHALHDADEIARRIVRGDQGKCRSAAGREAVDDALDHDVRSEEHTSELQSLMRNSYAVFFLQNKNIPKTESA